QRYRYPMALPYAGHLLPARSLDEAGLEPPDINHLRVHHLFLACPGLPGEPEIPYEHRVRWVLGCADIQSGAPGLPNDGHLLKGGQFQPPRLDPTEGRQAAPD